MNTNHCLDLCFWLIRVVRKKNGRQVGLERCWGHVKAGLGKWAGGCLLYINIYDGESNYERLNNQL